MIRDTCFLIIEPKHTYDGRLVGITVDRMVKTRPTKLGARFIAVELHVDVDERLFQQSMPEATITLRDVRDFIAPSIEVEQQEEPDATQGGERSDDSPGEIQDGMAADSRVGRSSGHAE